MKCYYFLIVLCIPFLLHADTGEDSLWLYKNYVKNEVYIPMRDGKKLFTAIYTPKDNSTKHPILINRTPYSIKPYGEGSFKSFWTNHYIQYFKEGYIMVIQDVRGRFMSEGEFEDVRPYNPKKGKNDIDEASDTYDTIEWLLDNIKNNNGKVGIFGISYPGFYSTMGALSQHPALVASSPQAPVTEWFIGDDFHHGGAFMLMDAFSFYSSFGKPRRELTKEWPERFKFNSQDNYDFYLKTGTLKDFARLMGDSIKFWHELYKHPDYDEWWQVRNTRTHVQHIPPHVATLVVGGLFDAEDCYGAWNLYKAIEEKTANDNRLVMGPWSHGGWGRGTGAYLGIIRFGSNASEYYQEHYELPFFNYHLKGKGRINNVKEANIFFTGANEWRYFEKWPPENVRLTAMFLQKDGKLHMRRPVFRKETYTKYISDPAKPVPYTEDIHFGRTREYMTDDQRFAARRPDVLVFETEVLDKDFKIAGPVIADLFTSISTTDADFIVKLIDVFPADFKYVDSVDGKGADSTYPMGGYQMLVRGEILRGRYRNSFEHPEPFEPNTITQVHYTLPDVAHVFKKGHKVMIQIQSSWFPLADRNPQQFVNIYEADKEDFVKSTIKIYHDDAHPSKIILPVID